MKRPLVTDLPQCARAGSSASPGRRGGDDGESPGLSAAPSPTGRHGGATLPSYQPRRKGSLLICAISRLQRPQCPPWEQRQRQEPGKARRSPHVQAPTRSTRVLLPGEGVRSHTPELVGQLRAASQHRMTLDSHALHSGIRGMAVRHCPMVTLNKSENVDI